jgi:hypothetical protein
MTVGEIQIGFTERKLQGAPVPRLQKVRVRTLPDLLLLTRELGEVRVDQLALHLRGFRVSDFLGVGSIRS